MCKTFLLVFLMIFLSSCNPFTPQPSLTPVPPGTVTVVVPISLPSQTPITFTPTFVTVTPTRISTSGIPTPPNANPNLPLNPSGPWLAYRGWPSGIEDQVGEVDVANPDGSGRRKVAGRVWSLAASPASPYLAVLIQPQEFQNVATGANTLEIVHLPDLSRKTIALLSSPTIQTFDYRQLKLSQIPDKESAIQVIAWAVSHEPPAWSPDGRYLAFAAAIDGPTADLYVYDTQKNQTRRLTDGLDMATKPEWSPNSQWIVHRGIQGFGAGCAETGVWAAAVDGSQVKRLSPGECYQITRWTGPQAFETFQPPLGGAAPSDYQGAVKRVDIAAGTVTQVGMRPGNQPGPVVDCLTKSPVPQPGLKTNAIRSDSPNGQWFIVTGGSLRLYASNGILVREFANLSQFYGWRPDSSALAFSTEGTQPGRRSIQVVQLPDRTLKTFENFLPAPSVYPDQVIWNSAAPGFFLMSAQNMQLFAVDPLRGSFLRVEEFLGKPVHQDIFWVGQATEFNFQWLPCIPGKP